MTYLTPARDVAGQYAPEAPARIRYRRIVDVGGSAAVETATVDPPEDLRRPPDIAEAGAAYDGSEPLDEVLGEMHVLCEDLALLRRRRADLWRIAWASGVPVGRIATLSGTSSTAVYRALDERGLRRRP